MKQLLSIAVLLIAVAAGAQQNDKTADQLIQMELNRSKAIAAKDSLTLDKMYATEFTGVTALGFQVRKEDLMAVFKRDNPGWSFTNDNHMVTFISKDVATLTGRLTAIEKATGKTVAQSLYIHVLAYRDGRWQIIQGQGTNLPLK